MILIICDQKDCKLHTAEWIIHKEFPVDKARHRKCLLWQSFIVVGFFFVCSSLLAFPAFNKQW